ncbi:hypothetical protein BU25DRAFT_61207 [Macroventuria anomochaeta]|uniref:Uncharacterized protein n=1 Tax=Macroventuria anomochaeta TaxID=301207 RepID=A0ACB6S1C3_9PLEO|nr:uncharacterized protein BU25DRAFT_61207 [Macroventuria anomochaeta]KAF2627312.1 hypothetical protein BU25DRAFT_61207 [Macroventuria anomochaeta]
MLCSYRTLEAVCGYEGVHKKSKILTASDDPAVAPPHLGTASTFGPQTRSAPAASPRCLTSVQSMPFTATLSIRCISSVLQDDGPAIVYCGYRWHRCSERSPGKYGPRLWRQVSNTRSQMHDIGSKMSHLSTNLKDLATILDYGHGKYKLQVLIDTESIMECVEKVQKEIRQIVKQNSGI